MQRFYIVVIRSIEIFASVAISLYDKDEAKHTN